MGLDFIRNAAPSFNRVLDRRLVEMNSPTLFSRDLPIISRTARAELCGESAVQQGETVLLRMVGDSVVVQRENNIIARCPRAPDEFITHLCAGAGIAKGTVTSVQPISQTLEIGLCD